MISKQALLLRIEELCSEKDELKEQVKVLSYEKNILQKQVNLLTGQYVNPVCSLCKKDD